MTTNGDGIAILITEGRNGFTVEVKFEPEQLGKSDGAPAIRKAGEDLKKALEAIVANRGKAPVAAAPVVEAAVTKAEAVVQAKLEEAKADTGVVDLAKLAQAAPEVKADRKKPTKASIPDAVDISKPAEAKAAEAKLEPVQEDKPVVPPAPFVSEEPIEKGKETAPSPVSFAKP
jgi:hypothetical protein